MGVETGRARRAGGLWLWISALSALAILIALGTWQMQRRDWKFGIIDRIERRVHAEPISLREAEAIWRETGDVEYLRVRVSGRFDHGQERHFYGIDEGKPGWRILTPLVTPGGETVLVDRGFVPEPRKSPGTRAEGQLAGAVTLTGLARAPGERGWFVPDNDPARNIWFWRDLPGLAATLPGELTARLTPFILEAEAGAVPGGWPKGGMTRLAIPNRHLEYALTWYGLALTLIGVFLFYLRSRSRSAVAPAAPPILPRQG